MPRSQESLARRAAKRSISVDEQRLKDRKKAKTEVASPTANSGDSSDWKCVSCQFDNYSSRTVCKQCSRDKNGVVVTKNPSSNKSKEISSKQVVSSSAPLPPTTPAVFDTNDWVCLKCNNKNFAHRSECNRCSSSKPTAIAPTVSKPVAVSSPNITPIKKSSSKPAGDTGSASKKPNKKSNWGQNASAEKIEENKLLLEIVQTDSKDGTALAQLSEEEQERAKILLMRKKRKQEKKVKLAKLKTMKEKKYKMNGKSEKK